MTRSSAPLRIAQVAPLWTTVPPRAYGGAELMVSWLTEELVRRGHDVTLFASGDSTTAARLEAVTERNLIDSMADREAYLYEPYAAAAIASALRRASDFDVIHCHLGIASVPATALSPTPVVHTVHAGMGSVDDLWVLERFPEIQLAAMSRSQTAALTPERRRRVPVIHHGCDLDAYEPCFEDGRYLAFLGRMGPHKNPVAAIDLARSHDLPIVLAGSPQDESEALYFEAEVKPLIDGDRVVWLGDVDHRSKVEHLRGAAALVFPIAWEEPFGLVMIEAMACGTPVLALSRGSVPEVVDPGVSGYHAGTIEELRALLPRTLSLDRERVRAQASHRFSHLRMVDEFVDLYHALRRRTSRWNVV
jgi:glycosyltransferase involved in cell wall biosynthesis